MMKRKLFERLKQRVPPEAFMKCLHESIKVLLRWARKKIWDKKSKTKSECEDLVDELLKDENDD